MFYNKTLNKNNQFYSVNVRIARILLASCLGHTDVEGRYPTTIRIPQNVYTYDLQEDTISAGSGTIDFQFRLKFRSGGDFRLNLRLQAETPVKGGMTITMCCSLKYWNLIYYLDQYL